VESQECAARRHGRWHGAAEWKDVTVDLGFVMSNDGHNFREPKHEWTLLQRGKDGEWDQGGLLQGQGFENIGSRPSSTTAPGTRPHRWNTPATRRSRHRHVLPRDRFADLVVDTSGEGPATTNCPR
jgi:hypothetical protein